MAIILPLLRLIFLLQNVFETFKTLKVPKLGRRGEPTLRSMKVRKREMKSHLAIWLVWGCWSTLERVVDNSIGILVPFYSEIKSIVLLFLLVSRSYGAEPIFLHIIRPVVKPHTKTIDFLLEYTSQFGDFLVVLICLPWHLLVDWWYKPPSDEPPPPYLDHVSDKDPPPSPQPPTEAGPIPNAETPQSQEVEKGHVVKEANGIHEAAEDRQLFKEQHLEISTNARVQTRRRTRNNPSHDPRIVPNIPSEQHLRAPRPQYPQVPHHQFIEPVRPAAPPPREQTLHLPAPRIMPHSSHSTDVYPPLPAHHSMSYPSAQVHAIPAPRFTSAINFSDGPVPIIDAHDGIDRPASFGRALPHVPRPTPHASQPNRIQPGFLPELEQPLIPLVGSSDDLSDQEEIKMVSRSPSVSSGTVSARSHTVSIRSTPAPEKVTDTLSNKHHSGNRTISANIQPPTVSSVLPQKRPLETAQPGKRVSGGRKQGMKANSLDEVYQENGSPKKKRRIEIAAHPAVVVSNQPSPPPRRTSARAASRARAAIVGQSKMEESSILPDSGLNVKKRKPPARTADSGSAQIMRLREPKVGNQSEVKSRTITRSLSVVHTTASRSVRKENPVSPTIAPKRTSMRTNTSRRKDTSMMHDIDASP